MIIETKDTEKNVEDMSDRIPPNENIPEDKILDHVELHCSKHGDITKGSIFASYTTKKEDDKTMQHQNFYCIQCLTELLNSFTEQGKIGKLQMVRVFRDRTPEDDKQEEQPIQENLQE